MTFEEAKNIFLNRGYIEVSGGTYYDADKWRNAIVVISKWLEQQPCDDAVSRKDVHDMLENLPVTVENKWFNWLQKACIRLAELPSVTPKEKTGYWIDDADKIDAQFDKHTYKCSECGKYAEYFVSGTEVWWDRIKPNFCPNCGTNMVEPQESEDVINDNKI